MSLARSFAHAFTAAALCLSAAAAAQSAPAGSSTGEPPPMNGPAPWEIKPVSPAAPSTEVTRDPPRNLFSINTLRWIDDTIAVDYERVARHDLSIYVEPSFTYFSTIGSYGTYSLHGYGTSVGLRYYPFRAAPSGLYFGGSASILFGRGTTLTQGYDPLVVTGYLATVSGMAGYTWIIIRHIEIALGLGFGVAFGTVTFEPILPSGAAQAFQFQPRASLGYSF